MAVSLSDSAAQSPIAAMQADPWIVQPRERARYEEQFRALNPMNGIITGNQAKGFMLQSQLPPLVLGQIWSLSDTDADGKMDINEFSIACKIINLKLRGFEIPKTLPSALISSVKNQSPTIPPLPNQILNLHSAVNTNNVAPMRPHPPKPAAPNLVGSLMSTQSQPVALMSENSQASLLTMNSSSLIQTLDSSAGMLQNLSQTTPVPVASAGNLGQSVASMLPMTTQPGFSTGIIPGMKPASVKPYTASVTDSAIGTPQSRSIDRIASLDSPAQLEWSVPHQAKLKYTQLFNTTDRARTGYLSGPQARNLMVQSKLPQAVLAQIWGLADMDSDGRLGCDEFVLAMHLCEQATIGKPPPAVLPPDMIPPAFRRTSITNIPNVPSGTNSRHGSLSSQGSQHADDPASTLLQTTFEDKRKENFEKGQAELERRRRALLEAQRAEAEARERKEREEQERRDRAKADQERKRQMEIQQQLQEQLEKERQLEEERKRQQEQREAARREMERQRQLEWEKQRSQELQQQRQRAQENVLRLKAKNQTLTIELSSLTDQVKDLSQKICNTRVGVSNVKTTIDGMRVTRDTHMQELSQLKTKLKEQNARLITLSQEKIKLEAKNKQNSQMNDHEVLEQTQAAFDNKEIAIKQLKDKLCDMEQQVNGKLNDIQNNNLQLSDLTSQLSSLVNECEVLYNDYEEKKSKVIQLKGTDNNTSAFYETAWKEDSSWAQPASNEWSNEATSPVITPASTSVKYRALYEFVARNQDEISFQPGDIIMVPHEQNGEPGWLAGEIRGHVGWFPQSYVEPMDAVESPSGLAAVADSVLSSAIHDDIGITRTLEGIDEVPEIVSETMISSTLETVPEIMPYDPTEIPSQPPDYFVACYPYQSIEQGDLSFAAGEIIDVVKQEGEWWTGKIGDKVGIFPSNYVQKAETSNGMVNGVSKVPVEENVVQTPVLDNGQTTLDDEISAINEKRKSIDKSPDFAAMAANTQTMKSSKKPEIASVLAPYQATSAEQLTLARGQLIMIRKKSESGWWEGELQAKGRRRQVGWFPATYVKVLESSGRTSGRNTPVSASRTDQQEMILDKVVSLFPYTAQNADELTFVKDDIISVTSREEPEWWRGELNGVSGLFPSNYVGPLQSQHNGLSGEDKKRSEHIYELITSERMYIEDLATVLEVFEVPLVQRRIINSDDHAKIFINWRDILKYNQNFYEDLITRTEQQFTNKIIIGDIFSSHIPRMVPYKRFCSQQLMATTNLQYMLDISPSFRIEMQKCQSHPKTKGMPLSSFLIKPMQRITKYPLLIAKILENTPKNHPDYVQLTTSLKETERFCQEINEIVRQTENSVKLNWLQRNIQYDDVQITFNSETNSVGHRTFLHHGFLTKVKSGKQLIGFLLNDFLLLVQPMKPIVDGEFSFYRKSDLPLKVYRQPLFINELSVTNQNRGSVDSMHSAIDNERLLVLKTPKMVLVLHAATANECNLWIKTITQAKLNYDQANKRAVVRAAESVESTPFQGRILVFVKDGAHFQRPTGKSICANIFCKLALSGQEQRTETTNAVLKNMLGPKQQMENCSPLSNAVCEWKTPMQFHFYDLQTDVLELTVYEECKFTPNIFLGHVSIKLMDIYAATQKTLGPLQHRLALEATKSGEVELKLDMQLFNNI